MHVFSCTGTGSQIFGKIGLVAIAEGGLTMRELAIVGVEGYLASRFIIILTLDLVRGIASASKTGKHF